MLDGRALKFFCMGKWMLARGQPYLCFKDICKGDMLDGKMSSMITHVETQFTMKVGVWRREMKPCCQGEAQSLQFEYYVNAGWECKCCE